MYTRIRPALAVFLLLLLLGSASQAAKIRIRREESSTLLDQFYKYWESAKAKAQQLYENVQMPKVDENLRDIYDKSTAAVSTYTGILTDQILHIIKGD